MQVRRCGNRRRRWDNVYLRLIRQLTAVPRSRGDSGRLSQSDATGYNNLACFRLVGGHFFIQIYQQMKKKETKS